MSLFISHSQNDKTGEKNGLWISSGMRYNYTRDSFRAIELL